MTPKERKELMEKMSTWTKADLEKISFGIAIMEASELLDIEVIEMFKRRYEQLAGTPWKLGYDAALFDAGKREH